MTRLRTTLVLCGGLALLLPLVAGALLELRLEDRAARRRAR